MCYLYICNESVTYSLVLLLYGIFRLYAIVFQIKTIFFYFADCCMVAVASLLRGPSIGVNHSQVAMFVWCS